MSVHFFLVVCVRLGVSNVSQASNKTAIYMQGAQEKQDSEGK